MASELGSLYLTFLLSAGLKKIGRVPISRASSKARIKKLTLCTVRPRRVVSGNCRSHISFQRRVPGKKKNGTYGSRSFGIAIVFVS